MMRECAHDPCGQTFEAKRADARFCSGSCRAAASRARRAVVGTRSVPTTAPDPVGRPEHPDEAATDERLRVMEERLMDLEGDVEVAEAERDGLRLLQARLEPALARAMAVVEEAQRAAEATAEAAVAPVREELARVQSEAVRPSDLAELRAAVARLERRLAAMESRDPAASAPERRLAEVEDAVITLARRVGRLREEFDVLVHAIAS